MQLRIAIWREGSAAMTRSDSLRARIGARMRERRRALGMTQEQCAALIGMRRVTITRIERGYRRLELPELATICETLGCTAEELLAGPPLAQSPMRNAQRLHDAPSLP